MGNGYIDKMFAKNIIQHLLNIRFLLSKSKQKENQNKVGSLNLLESAVHVLIAAISCHKVLEVGGSQNILRK